MTTLPDLTKKQQIFTMRYVANGFTDPNSAYREAYDCSKMSDNSVSVEASKMLKNPKITLWINSARANVQEVIQEEIKYSAKDCFDELAEVQLRAKKDKGNYTQEIKAIELKGKLAGHFVDKHQVTGGGLADLLDNLK